LILNVDTLSQAERSVTVSEDRLEELVWRKSSACYPSECVEVAVRGNWILIRDSSDSAGVLLRFSCQGWQMFVIGIRFHADNLEQELL